MKLSTKILAFLTFIPTVTATTGVGPLDMVLRMIANFFNAPVLQQPQIQEGIIRFGLFVMIFSLGNYSLKNVFNDKKVAGTVSFIIAFIGIFLMPERWLLLTGGTISVITGGAIILGLLGGLIYFAMVKMSGHWVNHLLGILILLVVNWLIVIYVVYAGIPAPEIQSYLQQQQTVSTAADPGQGENLNNDNMQAEPMNSPRRKVQTKGKNIPAGGKPSQQTSQSNIPPAKNPDTTKQERQDIQSAAPPTGDYQAPTQADAKKLEGRNPQYIGKKPQQWLTSPKRDYKMQDAPKANTDSPQSAQDTSETSALIENSGIPAQVLVGPVEAAEPQYIGKKPTQWLTSPKRDYKMQKPQGSMDATQVYIEPSKNTNLDIGLNRELNINIPSEGEMQ